MTEPDASVNRTALFTGGAGERQSPLPSENYVSLILKQILDMLIEVFEARAGSLFLAAAPLQKARLADCPAQVVDYLTHLENLVARRIKSGPWRIVDDELLLSATPFAAHNLVVVNAPLLKDTQLVGVISLILSNQTYTHFKHLTLLPVLAKGLGRFTTTILETASHYRDWADAQKACITVAEEYRGDFGARFYSQSLRPMAEVIENLDQAQKLVKTNPELAMTVLASLQKTAQEATTQARTLLWQSVPLAFRAGGLIPALQQYVSRLNKTEKFIVDAELTPLPAGVVGPVERAVFLIIQEAVNNIRLHAVASYVKITISVRANQLLVHIKDNGVGFVPAVVDVHYGLPAMKQEAERIGGILAINSETGGVGRGTVVTLSAPLQV